MINGNSGDLNRTANPELVIFIGLPGAGKTTFYNVQFAQTHMHVSKDRMPNNRNPARRQQQLVREALQQGQSVVVDNTNPSVQSRAAVLHIARELNAVTTAYFFDTPKGECVRRNKAREGKGKVPDVAIYMTAAKLKPPQPEEQFDAIYKVTPASEQGTTVTKVS